MARVFETQTIDIDPNNPNPVITNVNLDKDFEVLEVAVITNTITNEAHRIITLGIVYDDAVTLQHSVSVLTIRVGNSIADVTDVALNDIGTIVFTEFVDDAIAGDSFITSIVTISVVGAQVNQYSTQKAQLDPSNPITVGLPVLAAGTLLESRLVNVGSIQHSTQEPTIGQGTLNAIEIIVSQA